VGQGAGRRKDLYYLSKKHNVCVSIFEKLFAKKRYNGSLKRDLDFY
jgi:hypothetical protein